MGAVMVKGQVEPGTPTDVKRFYLPGVSVICKCKTCKKDVQKDFGDNYLSYPTTNEPFSHTMYCSECDGETVIWLKLNLSLTAVGPQT
jgi:hypothetical protein